jgi:hypothetical protein
MTMIFVDRGRLHDGQPILPLGTWMKRAANKTTDAINDGPAHVVTDLYRDPNVKAALEKLFNNKCAYCESPGFAGFPWDVEHFRPKGSVAEDERAAEVEAFAAAPDGYLYLPAGRAGIAWYRFAGKQRAAGHDERGLSLPGPDSAT